MFILTKKTASLGLLIGLLAAVDIQAAYATEKNITIGTAGVTGVYYPAGGAVCRLVNRGRKEHGIRCGVESTGGSISNLEGLRKHDIDMGIIQSDLLYNAYKGTEIFRDVGADEGLRFVFALHSEPFTIVARADAKIRILDDLQGKRVDIGAPGSGMRATMEELMKRKGWTEKTFAKVVDVKASDQVAALCGNQVDAVVFAGGHPNGATQQLTSACETKLVSSAGPIINEFISQKPYFTYSVIPGNMYPNNHEDVRTFGVRAVLTASDQLDEDIVYNIVKSMFENIENFKTLHPVFATLDPKEMVLNNGLAPYHPGALRYYREKGYIQ